MKYLVYISTAVRLLNETELQHLLKKSQANNLHNKLTGILLYSEGSFLQVLEGPGKELDETYNEIVGDKRHKNIVKLTEGLLEERIFPDWSMGFKVVSTEIFSKFDSYIDPKNRDIWKKETEHPALSIVKTFALTNKF